MTLDVYADPFDDDLTAVADRLDQIARRTAIELASPGAAQPGLFASEQPINSKSRRRSGPSI